MSGCGSREERLVAAVGGRLSKNGIASTSHTILADIVGREAVIDILRDLDSIERSAML